MSFHPFLSTNRTFLLFPAAALAAAACGTTIQGGNGGGGGGGSTSTSTSSTSTSTSTSTTSTSTSTSTSSTSTSTSTSTSGLPGCPSSPPLTGPCAPSGSCTVGGSVCLSHVSQAGSATPGFRVSHLAFTKPKAFTTGIIAGVFDGAVTPTDVACNLNGSGTFSWLMHLDFAAGTVTTGGAKPSSNPAGPFAFVDEMVSTGGTAVHVHPVTAPGGLAPDCTLAATVGDVYMPMYLDAAGTSSIILPLHSVRFHDVAVSPDLGCIGRYAAETLDPVNSCLSDSQHPLFQDGGTIDSFMTLEEADTIIVSALNESLCVMLSQNPAMFGQVNSQGVTMCKRDAANHILLQGDWCTATNAPASATCADADALSGTFAAQGVLIQ